MAWQVEMQMPPDEFDDWCNWLFIIKPEAEKEAMKKAQRESKSKRSRGGI